MGDTYSAATPKGRVNQAQSDYANNKISFNEMRKRVQAEGYELTGNAAEIKERWGNRRGRRQ